MPFKYQTTTEAKEKFEETVTSLMGGGKKPSKADATEQAIVILEAKDVRTCVSREVRTHLYDCDPAKATSVMCGCYSGFTGVIEAVLYNMAQRFVSRH